MLIRPQRMNISPIWCKKTEFLAQNTMSLQRWELCQSLELRQIATLISVKQVSFFGDHLPSSFGLKILVCTNGEFLKRFISTTVIPTEYIDFEGQAASNDLYGKSLTPLALENVMALLNYDPFLNKLK